MLTFTVVLTCTLVVVVLTQVRLIGQLREQLHYHTVRDRVGDVGLHAELRRTQRRIAGLLASPRTYLRARRLLGPLELEAAEITAELELLEVT